MPFRDQQFSKCSSSIQLSIFPLKSSLQAHKNSENKKNQSFHRAKLTKCSSSSAYKNQSKLVIRETSAQLPSINANAGKSNEKNCSNFNQQPSKLQKIQQKSEQRQVSSILKHIHDHNCAITKNNKRVIPQNQNDDMKAISIRSIEKKTGISRLALQKQSQSIEQFTKLAKWSHLKVYLLECSETVQGRTERDQLILWKKGLISLKSDRRIIADRHSKLMGDPFLFILGNCEILIEGTQLQVIRKYKKGNLFSGDLEDTVRTIHFVSSYQVYD